MYMVNVLNSVVESDVFIYVLIFILACISVAMLYLIYVQNKRVNEEIQQKRLQRENDEKYLEDKKVEIVEPTNLSIPENIELTKSFYINDALELKNITKELESVPKERKINLTPYEEEQEESAIISYEELLSKTNKIDLDYGNNDDLFSKEEEIVLDTKIVSNDPRIDITSYEHEEEFLKALKQLQKMIN